jgi:hypothetical protein
MKMCRHCGIRVASRPRGLCWSDYYDLQIRSQYRSTSKFGRRGIGSTRNALPLPAHPTNAPPGTPEKVAVLEQRAKNGEALFHPQDAGMASVLAIAS